MKLIFRVLCILMIFGGGCLPTGCATQQQVAQIIARSNAAMMTPNIEKAGDQQGRGWEEAVAGIDQLISAYPDQPVLVNHLRVRQAMLLTANRQDNLAAQRWGQIEAGQLKTERDKALYDLHEALVWWYVRASDPAPLDEIEARQASGFIRMLGASIERLRSRDLRIYLGTIRTQMLLKLRNGADVSDRAKREQVAEALVDDLEGYVALFSPDDAKWVRQNQTTDLGAVGMSIADLRYRVWLREIVLAYKAMADALLAGGNDSGGSPGSSGGPAVLEPVPDWRPSWINAY